MFGADAVDKPLHVSEFASLAERTVRDAVYDSEAGTDLSEYALIRVACFVFQETAVWETWFQILQIRFSNRCKHLSLFCFRVILDSAACSFLAA